MRKTLEVLIVALSVSSFAALGAGVVDSDTVKAAAKNYLGPKCNPETPCTFWALWKDDQWLVVADLTKRNSPNEPARGYPGGQVFFTFDAAGKLLEHHNGE